MMEETKNMIWFVLISLLVIVGISFALAVLFSKKETVQEAGIVSVNINNKPVKICPKCNAETSEDASFCATCGHKLS